MKRLLKKRRTYVVFLHFFLTSDNTKRKKEFDFSIFFFPLQSVLPCFFRFKHSVNIEVCLLAVAQVFYMKQKLRT